ncbi:hypothetical protein [Candidatus Aalborgicola defluviihabitans]|uniref:hypothetical protein n=1 Tax=Candidatus Aalborgicola defluviihabitans TaxID=3386187 RepID=UPI001EB3ADE1|nr:hypothetical protein [Burkholderiales bacterium]
MRPIRAWTLTLRIISHGIEQLAHRAGFAADYPLPAHWTTSCGLCACDGGGRIVKTGGEEFALNQETRGYDWTTPPTSAPAAPAEGATMNTATASGGTAIQALRSAALERMGALAVPPPPTERRFAIIAALTASHPACRNPAHAFGIW